MSLEETRRNGLAPDSVLTDHNVATRALFYSMGVSFSKRGALYVMNEYNRQITVPFATDIPLEEIRTDLGNNLQKVLQNFLGGTQTKEGNPFPLSHVLGYSIEELAIENGKHFYVIQFDIPSAVKASVSAEQHRHIGDMIQFAGERVEKAAGVLEKYIAAYVELEEKPQAVIEQLRREHAKNESITRGSRPTTNPAALR